jgi:hypothetical protein
LLGRLDRQRAGEAAEEGGGLGKQRGRVAGLERLQLRHKRHQAGIGAEQCADIA